MSRVSNDAAVLLDLATNLGGNAAARAVLVEAFNTTAVADLGALTAAAVAVTFSANEPAAANGALTVADGAAITAAETAEAVQEFEAFSVAVVADLASIRTKLNALLDALQAANIVPAS